MYIDLIELNDLKEFLRVNYFAKSLFTWKSIERIIFAYGNILSDRDGEVSTNLAH